MAMKSPRSKHSNACGLGGCFKVKAGAGLFCADHWQLVTSETQKHYCDVMLDGTRTAEEKKLALDMLELSALGEIARALEAQEERKGKK